MSTHRFGHHGNPVVRLATKKRGCVRASSARPGSRLLRASATRCSGWWLLPGAWPPTAPSRAFPTWFQPANPLSNPVARLLKAKCRSRNQTHSATRLQTNVGAANPVGRLKGLCPWTPQESLCQATPANDCVQLTRKLAHATSDEPANPMPCAIPTRSRPSGPAPISAIFECGVQPHPKSAQVSEVALEICTGASSPSSLHP